MARRPLGRGLSALLGDEGEKPAGESSLELGIDLIEPNREQPRTRFAEKALSELAASITSNGIVQPVVVRPLPDGRYQIVAGERRWRAAQRAGLRKIPAVVREVSDDKLLELALIENIQREELNPIEEARAYKKLIDAVGLTQENVAQRVGKERSLIATSLRLLKLPNEVLELIEQGSVSAGHGRALLMTGDRSAQISIAALIAQKGLSVRETERSVKRSLQSPEVSARSHPAPKDANYKAAETKLQRKFGTKVTIFPGKESSGRIELEYYGEDDLDRIYRLLMG